jgi:4-amino-4-deoxy-L-arabinose transferase-like glycosyltransferase
VRRLPAGAVRRLPRATWLCALVALANGLAWSIIVPPFQVPDENAHYAYVQQVAERGTLPHQAANEGPLSPREDAMLGAVGFYTIIGEPHNPAPFSQLQQNGIEATAKRKLSARGDGDALTATNNPPLYYALEAIPYKLTPSGSVLDRLATMRALSAVMGALTVLLIFLFLRELLPGTPLAWSGGALVAAFQPLFGFMSGGVNNDDLLYLMAAGVLWALARAFRRGLTPSTGALLGAFLGLGLVTKLTLLGFVPGVALAVLLLLRRGWSGDRATALRGAGAALGLGAGPSVLYLLLNHTVWHRSAIPGGVGSVAATAGRIFSFREEVSHIWQLYLPRLWLHPQFGYFPLWDTWFKGLVGRFGWLDYVFPGWVYYIAFPILLTIVALAVAELLRRRVTVRGRLGELVVYLLLIVGLCGEIGVQSYRYLIISGGQFEQARYLLSLLGLYGAAVALAVRFGGRRWGPVIAAALVVLAIGHDVFSQVLTIARYYT